MTRKKKARPKNSSRRAVAHNSRAPKRNAERGGATHKAEGPAFADADLRQVIGPDAIKHIAVRSLRPRAGNARRHSASQIEQIAASIRQFGFINPLIVDDIVSTA